MKRIIARSRRVPAITLVYAARDTEHNEAVVLRDTFRRFSSSLSQFSQQRSFVDRNMVGFIALDLILRFIFTGVNRSAVEENLGREDFDYLTADSGSLRILNDRPV